jgi:hypothetical protein
VTEQGLHFGSAGRQVDAYDPERALAVVHGGDALAGHASCLGMGLGEAAHVLGFPAEDEHLLLGSDAAIISNWTSKSPIVVTQNGSLGDPGTRDTSWFYTVDPSSARRFLARPGGFSAAIAQRECWRGMPKPTFGKLAVMSQITGLDNSRLLPPYFPVYRGEDYLFGAMVEYLHPHAATLEYPWCVPHLPVEPRPADPGDGERFAMATLNPARYVTDRTNYQAGISTTTRLAGLTQMVKELAELSDDALLTRYRVEVAENRAMRLRMLTRTIGDGVARPAEWRAVLEEGVAAINRASQIPAKPDQLPGLAGRSTADLFNTFRGHARGLALGLETWGAVRDTATGIFDKIIARDGLRSR